MSVSEHRKRAEGETRRLIFVGGAPRSGTTLVQNMLDSHPRIVGGPEFLHLADIVGLRRSVQSAVARGWIEQFCDRERADALFGGLIADFLVPLADRHGADFVSEKTPSNVLVFPELMELCPEARCIFVARDPRAIVSSMLEVGRRAKRKGLGRKPFMRDTMEAIRHVRACFEAAEAAAERQPGRMLTVRYEDLVAGPEAETRRICGFVGLDWSARMLKPGEQAHPAERPMTELSGNLWYDARSFRRNPEAGAVEKWRSRLSAHQKALLKIHFADFPPARRFGYDLSDGGASLLERVQGAGALALRQARQRLGRATRALRAS